MTDATKPELVKPMVDVKFESDGGQRVRVVPATIHVKDPEPLKTIRWTNETKKPVHVWLPSVLDLVESTEEEKDLLKPIRVDPGKTLVVYVNAKALEGTWVRDYHVFCEGTGDFAVGNSPPIMSCP
jgi:hypothetical protein